MLAGSRASNITTPGPGQYTPIYKTDISFRTDKRKGVGLKMGSPNSSLNKSKSMISHSSSIIGLDGSPSKCYDNSIHTSMIKDDLMVRFVGRNDSHMGPGAYNVPLSTFGKKTFNTKAKESIERSEMLRSPRKKGLGKASTHYDADGSRSAMLRRHSFQGVPLKYGP